MLLGDLAVLMRIDDDEARFVIFEMPFDQRQGAFADRTEADHDNGASDAGMHGRRGRRHRISPDMRCDMRSLGQVRVSEDDKWRPKSSLKRPWPRSLQAHL